jgi:hypothetical protein
MQRYAFISRHSPTKEQHHIANINGIELVPVGDADGFNRAAIRSIAIQHDGVVVVHAGAACAALSAGFPVGIFENANRAPEGEKPTFTPVALHIYA